VLENWRLPPPRVPLGCARACSIVGTYDSATRCGAIVPCTHTQAVFPRADPDELEARIDRRRGGLDEHWSQLILHVERAARQGDLHSAAPTPLLRHCELGARGERRFPQLPWSTGSENQRERVSSKVGTTPTSALGSSPFPPRSLKEGRTHRPEGKYCTYARTRPDTAVQIEFPHSTSKIKPACSTYLP
jgi:hypothetical protein